MKSIRTISKAGLIAFAGIYGLTTLILLEHSTHYRIDAIKLNQLKVKDGYQLTANFKAYYIHHFNIEDLGFNVLKAIRIIDGPPGTYCKPLAEIKKINFEIVDVKSGASRDITELVLWDTTQTNWFLPPRNVGQPNKLSFNEASKGTNLKTLAEFEEFYNSIDSIHSDNDLIHGYGNKDYYFLTRQSFGDDSTIKITIEYADGKRVTSEVGR